MTQIKTKKQIRNRPIARRDFLKTSLLTVGLIASQKAPLPFASSTDSNTSKDQTVVMAIELQGRTAADIHPVGPKYQRFDARSTAFARSNYDKESVAFGALTRYNRVLMERVKRNEPGFTVKDYALNYASRSILDFTGSGFGNLGKGLYSWSPLRKDLSRSLKLNAAPVEASKIVKKAAKHLGADLVGVCLLDKRWIYSNDDAGRRIEFEEVEEGYATKEKIVIPDSHKYVVVMAVKMDNEPLSYAPYVPQAAEVSLGYDKMAIMAARVAEFLRALGYNAIPSGNDTALSVPLAIDAGLGQYGRIDRLVTPQYGPMVRLCKVLTDLPLTPDQPIDFGLVDFCNACKKCADACPAQSLSHGETTWEGSSKSNNPGILKWYQDPDKCLKFWGEMGTGCAICFRVCPWSNGVTKHSEAVKWAAQNIRPLDPVWRPLDELLGYGRLRNPEEFWE